jgi:sugar lactone lactonase YvrE
VNAFASAADHLDSELRTVFYNLLPAPAPVFNPSPGLLTNHSYISITTATTNAIIRYTIDGSIPDTNSSLYSSPLVFTNPMTLSARVFRDDLDPSAVQQGFYSLVDWESFVVTTVAGGASAGFSNAVGALARFSSPQGVCVDAFGNLYVADAGNNVIRKVIPSGLVTTFAGTGMAGSQTGPAESAQFSAPCDVAVDRLGNVYVADRGNNRICKIETNGIVTALASVSTGGLWQMSIDSSGNIYVGSNGTVQKILPDGTVVGVGGSMNYTCSDGWCTFVGAGVDAFTNAYAATEFKIWRITPGGFTELFAGPGGYSQGFSDGPRLLALFQGPEAIAFDSSTNMIVTDQFRIRKIRQDGWVSTIAGTGDWGYRNGRGSEAMFNSAYGLCVDTNQNIYVADSANNCIRKISPDTARVGIADDWQRAHFGYVGIDPNADPDHDGMNNYTEFWAGTDPLDSDSVLVIKSVSVVSNGYTQITWPSATTKNYTVKYSDDMRTWNTLQSAMPGNGSTLSIVDSNPLVNEPRRFYRVFVDF